jgi:2'-5' RNA ligase
MHQTALLVEVPQAEPLVSSWRLGYDPVAANGVPAHITVLFPFVAPDGIDDAVLRAVADVAASVEPFEFELTAVDEFPGVVWLRPAPEDRFRDLTARLWAAFPDHPPYEGRHADSQPHVTVAMVDDEDQPALSSRIRADLEHRLPVTSVATSLSVFVSRGDHRWRREHVVEFGA